MKFGVIVVTYNRLDLLKEVVDACSRQTYPFEEILIVNNASTDGTTEYLKTIKNKKIKVITLKKNSGGAGGFYEGTKYFLDKKIDYLLYIDDDAVIDLNYNKNILDNISKDEKIIGYSGTVYTENNIIFEHRRYLKKHFKQINSTSSDYEQSFFDYDLSTFCGVFLSMKIIKKIGLPKKEFFIWFDDTEYCLRANKYGKIRNINSSFLNHKTKISNQSGYNWKSYYGIRNNYYIVKEYYGKLDLFKYKLNCYLHFLGGKFLSLFKNKDYYNCVSNIYIDALYDAKNNVFGINEKYTYKLKIEKK